MEKWKRFKNTKYLVSNKGRVKSLKRKKPLILKQQKNRTGYLYVDLYYENKKKRWTVHRLVMHGWKGASNLIVLHDPDPNKENCKLNNLKYGTHTENIKNDFINGYRSHKGSKHPQSKLTEIQVKILRKKTKETHDGNLIFKKDEMLEFLNIHKRTFQAAIEKKETWKHI